MEENKQITEKDSHSPVELHQRELTDLMGDAPDWLIHSGSYLLYGILALFLVGTALISYPDVVRGSATIDDLANLEWITVNSSGQIDAVFVENDSLVKRGDTIAILQNPTRLKDVRKFYKTIHFVEKYYETNNADSLKKLPFDLSMGEMSDAYQNFTKAVRNCLIYDEHNYYPQQKNFLQKQLNFLKKDSDKNELAILKMEQDIFNLSISHKVEIEKNREQLELAYEEMVNALRTWESKYLIRSPGKGRINIGEERTLMRMVNRGDTIGSILSNKKGEYVARVQLGEEQVAGITAGNPVNIRLAKYPEHAYGILTGEVHSITFAPYNKKYIVDITFPHQLVTSNKKEIKYELGLKGEVEIITSSHSILSRIFNPIINLFMSNKKTINN